MSEKVSLKTIYVISLIFFGIVLILGACMSPVDIDVFLEDKTVQSVIDNSLNPGLVIIDTANSDKGLKAGNRKIEGLTIGKYYKIEEIEDGKVTYTGFVKAGGTLSEELKDIKKLTVTTITGLTNDITYRVTSAKPYTKPNTTDKIKYFALTNNPSDTPKDAALTTGAVTIQENKSNCFFDVSPLIDAKKYYEVINVGKWTNARTSAYRRPIGGNGPISSPLDPDDYEKFNSVLDIGIYLYDPAKYTVTGGNSFLPNMSIMDLPAVNTVNDYVFVEYYAPDSTKPKEVITRDFYVLTVTVNSAPTTGGGNITIDPPTTPTDEIIKLTYKNGTEISEGEKITISLLNDTDKTIKAEGGNVGTYKWFYDNAVNFATNNNNIVIGNAPLNAAGTYRITVEKTVIIGGGNIIYSKGFILEITQ